MLILNNSRTIKVLHVKEGKNIDQVLANLISNESKSQLILLTLEPNI